ncbi:MAG: hypothetical protein NTX76_00850 [Alphaproteobacteria bacterium]|nr:hypothetical protein [Alphaproteobacteria bacterium]
MNSIKMCFSATASFSAAALLIPTGAYCLYQSIQKNKKYAILGSVPLLFGIQQFSEGFVWTGMKMGSQTLTTIAAYSFLFFAFFLWPFWIGLSIYPITPPAYKNKRMIIKLFIIIGIILSIYYCIPLFAYYPNVDIILNKGSVCYKHAHCLGYKHVPFVDSMLFNEFLLAVYVLVTMGPALLSPDRRIRLFGWLLGGSLVLTGIFYHYAMYSVWCLFSALISSYIVSIIHLDAVKHKAA